jgi:hypothetical protein
MLFSSHKLQVESLAILAIQQFFQSTQPELSATSESSLRLQGTLRFSLLQQNTLAPF